MDEATKGSSGAMYGLAAQAAQYEATIETKNRKIRELELELIHLRHELRMLRAEMDEARFQRRHY